MDKKLRKLFAYQRFEQNKDLQDIINKTLSQETTMVLSDELLGAVAGGQDQTDTNKDKEKNKI